MAHHNSGDSYLIPRNMVKRNSDVGYLTEDHEAYVLPDWASEDLAKSLSDISKEATKKLLPKGTQLNCLSINQGGVNRKTGEVTYDILTVSAYLPWSGAHVEIYFLPAHIIQFPYLVGRDGEEYTDVLASEYFEREMKKMQDNPSKIITYSEFLGD